MKAVITVYTNTPDNREVQSLLKSMKDGISVNTYASNGRLSLVNPLPNQ